MTQKFLLGSLLLVTSCVSRKYLKTPQEMQPQSGDFFVPIQVTAGNESNFSPDLSPNGVFVVYTSDRSGNKDVWEKKTTGGYARALTRHSADDFSPVLSPKGDRVAFVSRRADAAGDIHILELGLSLSKLVGDKEGAVSHIENKWAEDGTPVWFPDGERVAFVARKPGDIESNIMVADVADLKPVSLIEAKGNQPAISPDGKLIAFVNNGGLSIYNDETKKVIKVTAGGTLQDGQPSFTADGKALLFIRYADDTNEDNRLNGDDRPTLWQLDLAVQTKQKKKENYQIKPLSSASFAAYSPQIRGSYLYFTLQARDTLDIFRLPAFGQSQPPENLAELLAVYDKRADYHEKIYVTRLAQSHFARQKKADETGEAALLELDTYVQHYKQAESEWAFAKLKSNFAKSPELIALAELAMIQMQQAPYSYPEVKQDPDNDAVQFLDYLIAEVDGIVKAYSAKDDAKSRRVQGRGSMVKARLLAARRDFFKASEIITKIPLEFPEDRKLAAQAAYFEGLLAPSIADRNTAVRALRRVVETYPEQRGIVRQASEQSIRIVTEGRKDYIEDIVALRTAAAGLPILPALAHTRIADDYLQEGKKAVAANELRQIVESYPQSPEVILPAAARLSRMDEEAGRYGAAEDMLRSLQKTLAKSGDDYKEQGQALLISFWLRRGETLLGEGKWQLATAEYQKIIAIDALNVSAHRGIIDASFGQPDFDEIVERYDDLAADHPDSAEYKYVHGYAQTYDIDGSESALGKIGEINDAIAVIEEARELDGQIIYIHQTLGWLYLQKGYWVDRLHRNGGVGGDLAMRWGLVEGFFGFADPNWLELAVDSFLTAYYLAPPNSLEQAWIGQNLGQTYYELKNYQKALTYYMERIKSLKVIPSRDKRVEAIIWRRAGRSAFQVDELQLAEALQRRALNTWEALGSDNDIALSLDALALTLQERGLWREAMALYDRLLEINRRQKRAENEAAALANLGYCAFKVEDYEATIRYMDESFAVAEAYLKTPEALEKEAESKVGAIQVDLGGQSSAADGFDVRMRQIMAISYRTRAFDKLGRHDLALVEQHRKLDLLHKYRAFLIDEKDAPDSVLAEQISITMNRIAEHDLEQGRSGQAKDGFAAAADEASKLRQEDQEYESRAEWINKVNYARVQLRLAYLGLLSNAEINSTIANIQSTHQRLSPVVDSGSTVEVPAIAQLGAIEASLRQLATKPAAAEGEVTTADDLWRKHLSRSIEISESLDQPELLRSVSLASLNANPEVPALSRKLRRVATGDPELEWKYFAARGQWPEAIAAVKAFLRAGQHLESQADRMTVRLIVERFFASIRSQGPEVLARAVRDYALLRSLEISLRTLDVQPDSSLLAQLKRVHEPVADDAWKNKLRPNEACLLIYQTLENEAFGILISPTTIEVKVANMSGGTKWSEFLATWTPFQRLKAGSHIYLSPIGDLFDVPWESVGSKTGTLGTRFTLSYIPSPDLLGSFRAKERIAQSLIGVLEPAEGTLQKALQKGNPHRDVLSIAVDQSDLAQQFNRFDVVHVATPFVLNDVEPGYSVIYASSAASFATYDKDLTAKRLGAADLGLVGVVVLNAARRNTSLLRPKGEGYDGWIGLAMSSLMAGVSTTVLADEEVAAKNQSRWLAFYKHLSTYSAAGALKKAQITARLIGYAGSPRAEAIARAEEELEDIVEEAEDYFAEKEYADAALTYRLAVPYADLADEEDVLMDSYEGMVKSLFSLKNYQDALRYQKRIAAKKKAGLKTEDVDPDEYAEAELDGAILAVRAEDYAEAKRLLDIAEKVFLAEDDPEFLGKIYFYRGLNLQNQKNYEGTVKAYERSYEYYKDEDELMAASRLLDIGNVYANTLNDYQVAIEYYDRAAEIFAEEDETEAYVRVLIDKANAYISLGQLQAAISTVERKILPEVPADEEPITWIRAMQIRANAYFRAGQYQEARNLNDVTLVAIADIESEAARALWEVDARSLKGLILSKFKQYEAAVAEFKIAVEIAARFKLQNKIALIYNNYGFVAREFGFVDLSIELFNEALQIDETLKSNTSIAFDKRNLGLSVLIKGDINRARSLLEEAKAISSDLGLAYNLVYCHFGLGDLALKEEQWQVAEENFKTALTLSLKGNMRDFVWRAQAGLGVAALARKQTEVSLAHFEDSIAVIEELAAGLKTEDSLTAFQSDSGIREVYDAYISVLMQQGKLAEAWTFAQRSRARVFVDSIGKENLQLAVDEDQALAEQVRESRSKLDLIAKALARVSKKRQADYTKRYEAQKAQFAAQLNAAETTNPFLASLLGVSAPELSTVRSRLPADMAIVDYYMTPTKIFIWVINDRELQGKVVNIDESQIGQSIEDFRSLMQNFSTTDYLGTELAQSILKPIADLLKGAGRLLIVPHKTLHFLPFAALPWEGGLLIDRFTISFADSVSDAAAMLGKEATQLSADSRILVLANPKLEEGSDLPFAEKEGKAIGRYYKSVSVLTGTAATEHAATEQSLHYDVLHFASHGKFLPATPVDSHLRLVGGQGEDGALTVREVYGLKTKAVLVTLSACDSGLGDMTTAEEIIGLRRSFYYAGAQSVVSSLWRIGDVASAMLMKRFYRYLSEGHAKDVALSKAQLTVRKYFNHPAYWAAFKLNGDYR